MTASSRKMNVQTNDTETPGKQTTPSWEYEEEYTPPFLPALILFPPVAPFFWKYHVRVNDKELHLGYSYYFRLCIDRSRIEKAEFLEHINGLTQWGGYGYRKSLKWQTGYITRNGPGIRLTFKDNENPIVFNCNEAQKVCRMLNTPVIGAVVH